LNLALSFSAVSPIAIGSLPAPKPNDGSVGIESLLIIEAPPPPPPPPSLPPPVIAAGLTGIDWNSIAASSSGELT